ncbi:DUF551 domain-containing protein [Gramella sp. BOM4]|nr:DUF551 domain-containing protein [Christiangramia bathymodioli]
MTDREKIMTGECVSPLTAERCPVCMDHCEASDYKQKINDLIDSGKNEIDFLDRRYEACKDIIHGYLGFNTSKEAGKLIEQIQAIRDLAAENIKKVSDNAWIKVGDDLPARDEDVLACFIGWDDMEFTRVLEYDHDEKNWIDWKGEVYTMITHWKPIQLPND